MDRIIVKNLTKSFDMNRKKKESLFSKIRHTFFDRKHKKVSFALKNLHFNVKEGEILGIIGNNGSGKSTLMRVIAGIYDHDSGKIETIGKLVSLISLNLGIKDRLSMRDNIFLCGSLFGMSNNEIREKFDDIVEFSELKEYIDEKMFTFSSGMVQRLVFSVAVHSNPDILLLDEVFEVGDVNFRNKSSEKIKELAKSGVSVIFISHDLNMIKKYCDRVLWINNGEIKNVGETEKIVESYKSYNLKNKTR